MNQRTPGRSICRETDYLPASTNKSRFIAAENPSYLSEENDEAGRVEYVDHSNHPMEKHGCNGCRCECSDSRGVSGSEEFLKYPFCIKMECLL